MAKLGEDRYYKRSGTSFYRMEHFDIADVFGRRKRPRLSVKVEIVGFNEGARLILSIENTAPVSARAPYFAFNSSLPFRRDEYGIDGNKSEGMPRLPFAGTDDRPYRYGENSYFLIHPGTVHKVAAISLGLRAQTLPETDLRIDYAICAEDVPLERNTVVVAIK